jgi:very-short-patch-repair endonuclease
MRNQSSKVRVAELAKRQFGRLAWWQLIELGISRTAINRWIEDGYLHRTLPTVYAVGHHAPSVEADLMAAVLYAGPGAALSHATAAWWLSLLDDKPPTIQVSTPRQCRSLKGVRVYPRRNRDRRLHRGLPVTTYPHTFIDLAATAPLRTLRKALANADYQNVLDLAAIDQAISRGTRGGTKLRAALKQHQPKLAWTKSELEIMLVEICERERIPLPQINAKVDGWELDAYWPEAKLAVELDGYGNHHTRGQLKRDRRKEMALRALQLTPIRYSGDQLKYERKQVVAELRDATAP